MLRSALLVLLLASPALAQAPHREGEYGGVNPSDGQVSKAERPKHKKMPRKGTLSWVGFEARNGGAELFLQSPAQFDVTQTVDGATLVVHLSLFFEFHSLHPGTARWRRRFRALGRYGRGVEE